jgi:hypothetical protein
MENSGSLHFLYILCFILIFSCSTEEEDTAAPLIQTPQPEAQTTAPTQYTLAVSAAEGGTISTEGGTYDEGTEVTITATPDEGYRFTGWEGNDSTNESLTITLNSDQTLQALFELILTQYTLAVSAAEGGTISTEGGTYDEGTEVTITATPNEGYRFTGWEGNDSTNESLTITLNSDQTLQALFELIPIYTLTVTTSEGGTVLIEAIETGESEEGTEVSITVEEGTNVSITAYANDDGGFGFQEWVGGNFTGNEENINITMNSDINIQGLFKVLNPLGAFDVSALEYIESSEGFKFYYNISNNLAAAWIEEFKRIMSYLNNIIPVKSRVPVEPRDGKSEMHIFSWTSIEESPFKEIIGDDSGACICGNQYGRYMILEINDNEFIYNDSHRFLVIVHEYFHVFQINASENSAPAFKFLGEGAAATLESLYSQQFFNENYFTRAQSEVTENAVNSPQLFEEYGEPEANYADSVFIFLSLIKELQIKNGLTQIEALKKVYVEYWQSGREGVNAEILFEEVFGFSLESFYESLKSYSPNINSVIPSQPITLEEIFEDL